MEQVLEGMPIEIFRAGDYGDKGRFTEAELDELVASFNPRTHEPVLTLHHDDTQGPHGVVTRLERRGSSLLAWFADVTSELKAWLAERPYAKRSVEIYPRSIFGQLAVRAVSFVSVPEVKGMAPLGATFKEGRDARGSYLAFSLELAPNDRRERLIEAVARETAARPNAEMAIGRHFSEQARMAAVMADKRLLSCVDAYMEAHPRCSALRAMEWAGLIEGGAASIRMTERAYTAPAAALSFSELYDQLEREKRHLNF